MNDDLILITNDLEYTNDNGEIIKYSLYYSLDENGNMIFTLRDPNGQEISSIETIDPDNYPSNIDLTSWPGIFEVVALAQAYINRNVINIEQNTQNKAPEYTRTIWRDNCTALNEVNMNNIENGIYNAYGRLNKIDTYFDSANGRFVRDIDHHGSNILGVNNIYLNKILPYTGDDKEDTTNKSYIDFSAPGEINIVANDVNIRGNSTLDNATVENITVNGTLKVKGVLEDIPRVKLSNIFAVKENEDGTFSDSDNLTIGSESNPTSLNVTKNLNVSGDLNLGTGDKAVTINKDFVTGIDSRLSETEKLLEDVTNVMNFVGAFENSPDVKDYNDGDVYVNTKNSLEYVLSNGAWIEIGNSDANAQAISKNTLDIENINSALNTLKEVIKYGTESPEETNYPDGTIYFKLIS